MRRGTKDIHRYIDVRVEQLKEDMNKAKDDYDKQWYNRIISELKWAQQEDKNCYMEEKK